jgi:spore germination protein YaaH
VRWSSLTRKLIAVAATAGLSIGLLTVPTAAAQEPAPVPMVTGWFGWWATDAQVRAMAERSEGVIDEVSMFWWAFNGANQPLCTYDKPMASRCQAPSSTPWTNPAYDRQRLILQNAGIRIQASITDLSKARAGELSEYLRSPNRRLAYARQIATWAVNAGVDGVDLDMENFAFNDGRETWEATRPRWIKFIEVLGQELRKNNLTLSATVPGGWNTNVPDTGYWVYAWGEIIDNIDRLIIMAYDFSWSSPGPIGPNDWARRVSQRAIVDVGAANASKVWIGSPQYGRNWVRRDASGWMTVGTCPSGWAPVSAFHTIASPDAAISLAKSNDKTPRWEATPGEYSFRYQASAAGTVAGRSVSCTVRRQVWYADTRSALQRASIVPELGIGGIAVWNFGSVQSDFYPRLAAFGRSIAPAPVNVEVKAPSSVAYGRMIDVQVATSSAKGPAAGSTATLLWAEGGTGPATAQGSQATEIATATLNSSGATTFRIEGTKTGRFWVRVTGDKEHSAAESSAVRTRVTWRVQPAQRTYTSKVSTQVQIAANVLPAREGVTVRLQRLTADGWRTNRTVTTDAQGRAVANVRITNPQTVTYRFVVPAADGLALGRTGKVTLTVTR